MNYLKIFYHYFLRDLKIFLSYKFNLIIQVLFVIVFMFFAQYSLLASSSSFQDYHYNLGKLLIGIALIDFMIACISVFNREVRNAQQFGTFEILFQLKIPIYLVIFASYSFTFIKTSLRIIIYFLLSAFIFNIEILFINIPLFILLIIFFSLPFIGVGLISASFIIYFKEGNIISLFVSISSVFLSGIFFPVDVLPEQLQVISAYNPLLNSMEIISNSIIANESPMPANIFNQSYVLNIISILVTVPIGIILVYYSLKASKLNGSLNHY